MRKSGSESGKPQKDQNDLWSELRDYERDITSNEPDRMLDMILEVLKVETNERMLAYLAAGPLEDVICMNTIDRVEREAAANKRFQRLLGGVWYYRASRRIEGAARRHHQGDAGKALRRPARRL